MGLAGFIPPEIKDKRISLHVLVSYVIHSLSLFESDLLGLVFLGELPGGKLTKIKAPSLPLSCTAI